MPEPKKTDKPAGEPDLEAQIKEMKAKLAEAQAEADKKGGILGKLKDLLSPAKKEPVEDEPQDEPQDDPEPKPKAKPKASDDSDEVKALKKRIAEMEKTQEEMKEAQAVEEMEKYLTGLLSKYKVTGEKAKKYFLWIMAERERSLPKGEELKDEDFKEMAKEANDLLSNTSVQEKKGRTLKPGETIPSLDAYKKMDPIQKNEFFNKFPEETQKYENFIAEDAGWRIYKKGSP